MIKDRRRACSKPGNRSIVFFANLVCDWPYENAVWSKWCKSLIVDVFSSSIAGQVMTCLCILCTEVDFLLLTVLRLWPSIIGLSLVQTSRLHHGRVNYKSTFRLRGCRNVFRQPETEHWIWEFNGLRNRQKFMIGDLNAIILSWRLRLLVLKDVCHDESSR